MWFIMSNHHFLTTQMGACTSAVTPTFEVATKGRYVYHTYKGTLVTKNKYFVKDPSPYDRVKGYMHHPIAAIWTDSNLTCIVCWIRHSKRVKTKFYCSDCKVGVCFAKERNHYLQWHYSEFNQYKNQSGR